ncbi:MAG: hypothetical protein ACM30D_02945, partial [Hyphomicrobiales bacterium]
PCAQAAEADKASKETLIKILFISHSFDLCEAFLCGTRPTRGRILCLRGLFRASSLDSVGL